MDKTTHLRLEEIIIVGTKTSKPLVEPLKASVEALQLAQALEVHHKDLTIMLQQVLLLEALQQGLAEQLRLAQPSVEVTWALVEALQQLSHLGRIFRHQYPLRTMLLNRSPIGSTKIKIIKQIIPIHHSETITNQMDKEGLCRTKIRIIIREVS